MNELARYLVQHVMIDFEGEVSFDAIRKLLRNEDSSTSRMLLAKLLDEDGVDQLMLTVADCLKEHLRTGINEAVMADQLVSYSES